MEPWHLKLYLEFLNGDRPLVSFIKVDGAYTFRKVVERRKHRCLPTRVRSTTPDWGREDGYYLFDGESIQYVNLVMDWRARQPKNRPRA
jgi:hypothetical protein